MVAGVNKCSRQVLREREREREKEREKERERERKRERERAQTVTNSRRLAHENVGILVPIQQMQVKLVFRSITAIN